MATIGMMLISIRPANSWISEQTGINDMSRWVHFLAYLIVVALPFVAWKGRIGVFFSFVVAAMGLSLEMAQAFVAGLSEASQDVFADMFGVVGGMLLGYNVRMLLSSLSGRSNVTVGISPSAAPSADTATRRNWLSKELPPSAS
jgi:hypothetical protein